MIPQIRGQCNPPADRADRPLCPQVWPTVLLRRTSVLPLVKTSAQGEFISPEHCNQKKGKPSNRRRNPKRPFWAAPLLRRTSVLPLGKTSAQGEFTSPEHCNQKKGKLSNRRRNPQNGPSGPRRLCGVRAFCLWAKPRRRANSLRPSIAIKMGEAARRAAEPTKKDIPEDVLFCGTSQHYYRCRCFRFTIKPNRSPAQRVRFGEEERRNE